MIVQYRRRFSFENPPMGLRRRPQGAAGAGAGAGRVGPLAPQYIYIQNLRRDSTNTYPEVSEMAGMYSRIGNRKAPD